MSTLSEAVLQLKAEKIIICTPYQDLYYSSTFLVVGRAFKLTLKSGVVELFERIIFLVTKSKINQRLQQKQGYQHSCNHGCHFIQHTAKHCQRSFFLYQDREQFTIASEDRKDNTSEHNTLHVNPIQRFSIRHTKAWAQQAPLHSEQVVVPGRRIPKSDSSPRGPLWHWAETCRQFRTREILNLSQLVKAPMPLRLFSGMKISWFKLWAFLVFDQWRPLALAAKRSEMGWQGKSSAGNMSLRLARMKSKHCWTMQVPVVPKFSVQNESSLQLKTWWTMN